MKSLTGMFVLFAAALLIALVIGCEEAKDPFTAKNISPVIADFRFKPDPTLQNIRTDSLKYRRGVSYLLHLEYQDPEFSNAPNRTLQARFKFLSGSGKIRNELFKKPSADSLAFAEAPASFNGDLFFTPDSAGIVSIELGLSDGVKESFARLTPSAIFFSNLLPIPSFAFRFLQSNNPYRLECNPANSQDRDGQIVTAIWNFGDNTSPVTVQGKTTVTHDYPRSGQYLVRLQMVDDDGAIASIEQFVTTVNQAPTAALSVTCVSANCQIGPQPADISGSAPLQMKYDAGGSVDPDGTIASYLIDFGDGETAQNDSGSHTYIADGNYNVVLTVRDNLGLAQTTTRRVEVNTPPIAKLKVTPTQGSFPLNCTIDATESFDPFGGDLSYQIFIDDQLRYTQDSVVHVFDIPKVPAYLIRLEVTSQRNQLRAVANQAVFVTNTPPIANFTYTPLNPQPTVQITFTSTSTDPDPTDAITNYRWIWGDGSEDAGSNLRSVVHSYNISRTYLVKLIVTDRFNGVGEKEISLEVR